MKYLITITFLVSHLFLFSQDCQKSLTSSVKYEINGHQYLLTPNIRDDEFSTFFLQSKTFTGARQFSMIKADDQDEHDLLLKPLNKEHQFFLGFDECQIECGGVYRFKRITIYEGKNLIYRGSGEFIDCD
ncbi:hypothetical protein [Aquimarina litoralis]|uniref:hypothetical protein n=1 Tax=Aquimarina litoralis TaxID=584605 RepID=UPI001C574D4E|nr:hypothetical protein [Aquimarina litoralis]MBW1298119.1 hypothetical protein [Aquimarina litoralis]